jgi:hypothetical protein
VVEVVVDASVSNRLLSDVTGGVMMSTNESFWQTRESQQYKKRRMNIRSWRLQLTVELVVDLSSFTKLPRSGG